MSQKIKVDKRRTNSIDIHVGEIELKVKSNGKVRWTGQKVEMNETNVTGCSDIIITIKLANYEELAQ